MGQSKPPEEQPEDRPQPRRLEETARRNENVPVYQLDTNEQQELNKRVGTTPRFLLSQPIESGLFAAELGRAPETPLSIETVRLRDRWKGEAFWNHQNSVLNARSFFQFGPVQPSHQSSYGFNAGGPLGRVGHLSGAFGQQKVQGMVNGNVLVPLETERTPLAEAPEVRKVIEGFLAAYPDELPNRTDFDPRALNTNASQRIDITSGNLRLDHELSDRHSFAASYNIDRSRVDAFQLVAGQNPDTEIHGHSARLAHTSTLSLSSVLVLGFRYQRVRSVLEAEPNAVGPKVRMGFQIQELGPDSEFPVDRVLDSFTWSGLYSWGRNSGKHTFKLGANLWRRNLSSFETNDSRGMFSFSNQFGRTAIENLLYGTPSRYTVTIGEIYRDFHSWRGQLYFGDDWRVGPALNLSLGLRYEFEGRPAEAENRDSVPYSCDCNNFAPRLAVAYRFGSTSVLRASYTVSFGEIFPVTYQQIRNNPPLVRQIQVQNPDLLDPLDGIDLEDPASRFSPTNISPDLATPYSHQYSLSIERSLGSQLQLRVAYVGSRSFKLFKAYVLNRAEIVPGIPQLPSTIDQRRSDQRYYEFYNIANGGIAYLDAAQVSLNLPYRLGFSLNAAYTFSKAIDLGNDYTSTAANGEVTRGRDQYPPLGFQDKKGLSNFDSPHALLVFAAYQFPDSRSETALLRGFLDGWTLSGTVLAKNGTPFTLYVGSDAPGYGNVDGSTGDRPSILDPSILGESFPDPDLSTSVLTRERFRFIRPGEVRGDLGRNTFRKGPIKNLNMALNKRIPIGERALQFRLEAYNLTNTPQFDEPQRNLSSPSFGRITNTLNQGRVLQGVLRLFF